MKLFHNLPLSRLHYFVILYKKLCCNELHHIWIHYNTALCKSRASSWKSYSCVCCGKKWSVLAYPIPLTHSVVCDIAAGEHWQGADRSRDIFEEQVPGASLSEIGSWRRSSVKSSRIFCFAEISSGFLVFFKETESLTYISLAFFLRKISFGSYRKWKSYFFSLSSKMEIYFYIALEFWIYVCIIHNRCPLCDFIVLLTSCK